MCRHVPKQMQQQVTHLHANGMLTYPAPMITLTKLKIVAGIAAPCGPSAAVLL
jgi:hypothetical protein